MHRRTARPAPNRIQSDRWIPLAAILAGALPLVWPALLNGYPILFSDTGGLLEMGFEPSIGWDKPWVYGPLLALLSLKTTLWLPLAAQAAILSYLLWNTQALLRAPSPARHLLLCLALGAGTAAPWITATLMPDMLTPAVVLGIAILALGTPPPKHRLATALLIAVAIAAHLSHLVVAATCIAAAALLTRAIPWRPLASFAAAIAFLLASNTVGHGRFTLSPYGAVFALARLVADGPARDYLAEACPQAGLILCRWQDKLTADSDQFLWDPASPFWADPAPLPIFAAEASRIVAATIARDPRRVAQDAIRNGMHQLGRLTLGDTLVADNLDSAVRPRIQAYLPAELPSYDRSLQSRGDLLPRAQKLIPIELAALGLAAVGCAVILTTALRRPTPIADLAALVLIGLAANALVTGALSTPHDRYQVRIAWLIVLPPLLAAQPRPQRRSGNQAASPATASGDIRTSAS